MQDVFEGVFQGSARGYGFVSAAGGDVFIPARMTGGAMHRDRVEYRVGYEREDGRRTGEVLRVIERGYAHVVGVYFHERGVGLVVPDERKLGAQVTVPKGKAKGAADGHKVVLRITKPPMAGEPPEGEVVEILGHVNDPGVDVLAILRQRELPVEFGAEVMRAAERVNREVEPADLRGREDFRGRLVITIDGEDTKDIDDAVAVERLGNGDYELSVHIADVTHYVREGTPLDREAFKRGTSVYLADRVVPMLPQALSNGICSLNPGVDRLTLSCIMELDQAGEVKAHRIVESVIHSRRRMSYTEVDALVTGADRGEYDDELIRMLGLMHELARALREKRQKRGAIGFDFPEAKISVDADGWPTDIRPYRRSAATGIIEEFMIAANETVAEECYWLEMPFIYRTHEEPDVDKLMRLRELVSAFGYTVKGRGTHPSAIQALLAKAEGTPEEHIINRMVLQSLKQARYTAENLGHFGLASKCYCHFTSPIRRYPDLQIHRIIKERICGRLDAERTEALAECMDAIAASCSRTERAAEAAEREVTDMKKAQYMSDKLGREYDGIISGVTSRGVYVALANTVEGMISVRDLPDDRYIYDAGGLCLRGERTRRVWRIGDRLRVQVVRVGIQQREIDFVPVHAERELSDEGGGGRQKDYADRRRI